MQLRGVGYESELAELAGREISLSVLEDALAKADPEAYDRVQAARRTRARSPRSPCAYVEHSRGAPWHGP